MRGPEFGHRSPVPTADDATLERTLRSQRTHRRVLGLASVFVGIAMSFADAYTLGLAVVASTDVRGRGEAQPAVWAAEVSHGWVTADSFRAEHARNQGRPDASQGRASARHRARSTPGGARRRIPAGHTRSRGRGRPVLCPAWLPARAARCERSVFRWSSGRRLAVEAAAIIEPALGVQAISRRCGVAAGGEIECRRGKGRCPADASQALCAMPAACLACS
jgi:hypothetical protein